MILDLFLALYNLLNAWHDAERIKKDKPVYHGINGLIYCLLVAGCWWFSDQDPLSVLRQLMLRQLSFDIPLNLMRGLKWSYDTPAEKPGAITDRVERFLFRGVSWLDEFSYSIIYIILIIHEYYI
jgi:hypothetical protein